MIHIQNTFLSNLYKQPFKIFNKILNTIEVVTVYVFRFRTLAHTGKDLRNPFLKALASKEEANRSGKMTVSCVDVCVPGVIVCISQTIKQSLSMTL